MDTLNAYTEEFLLDAEESGAMEPWEAGFIRGASLEEELEDEEEL